MKFKPEFGWGMYLIGISIYAILIFIICLTIYLIYCWAMGYPPPAMGGDVHVPIIINGFPY